MAPNFEVFFRLVSYAAVFCGFLALWVSGTFGIVGTTVFIAIMIAAWILEDSRWQISERVGTALIVLALPLFYLIWRYQLISLYGSETVIAGILARMILALTAIKLLQKKGDRDWIFLYLMAFFEVLLAAGLSISALYLVTFLAYLLVMVCSIIAFEMRKTARDVEAKTAIDKKKGVSAFTSTAVVPARRLPTTSIALIVFIVMLAAPLFFMLPRVGGAGFGGKQGGLNTQTGFSDRVRLGGFGTLQQNTEVVMRVKLEPSDEIITSLYFRGTALDTFDNQAWSRARTATKEPYVRGEREFIQIDQPAGRDSLSTQTIYLEPLDTAVLFALPKAVAVQSSFPLIEKDTYGSLTFRRNYERVSYKVLSDRSLPDKARLREDNNGYGPESQNYLQLPESYDKRIFDLAYSIASKEKNRYDRAVAVEKYLQNNFGYTLEQKANGDEPLADFLFNVREGHCEYFATAMAVMLRTQGIATRIVNGFHGGEYNETSDMTVVRASNAHSWVEVYFPKENVWVPFDPTPFSGDTTAASTGFVGQFNKYVEALEAFWIQYFVAFDNQEQRSLVKTLRNGFVDYQAQSASYFTHAQDILAEWWKDVRGDKGMQSSLAAIGYAVAYVVGGILGILLFVWIARKIAKMNFWRRVRNRVAFKQRDSVVEFYERMQQSLAKKGISRQPFQTPLEFAFGLGSAEVVSITQKYNRVRFGEKDLTAEEASEIEGWLQKIEAADDQ